MYVCKEEAQEEERQKLDANGNKTGTLPFTVIATAKLMLFQQIARYEELKWYLIFHRRRRRIFSILASVFLFCFVSSLEST